MCMLVCVRVIFFSVCFSFTLYPCVYVKRRVCCWCCLPLLLLLLFSLSPKLKLWINKIENALCYIYYDYCTAATSCCLSTLTWNLPRAARSGHAFALYSVTPHVFLKAYTQLYEHSTVFSSLFFFTCFCISFSLWWLAFLCHKAAVTHGKCRIAFSFGPKPKQREKVLLVDSQLNREWNGATFKPIANYDHININSIVQCSKENTLNASPLVCVNAVQACIFRFVLLLAFHSVRGRFYICPF